MLIRHPRMTPAICCLAAGLAASAAPAAGQGATDAQLRAVDDIFAEWTRVGSPGAAVVVTRNGDVLLEKGYGHANLDYGIPITPRTRFDIASVSKHFTAFAILLLAEQGRLSLDDPITNHLRDLPDFARPVTIRHLVHHTSGIRDWVELLSIAGYRFDDVISLSDIRTFIAAQRGLNFEPGAEHLYSNTGYNLLAEIVARVSGQPFARFMKQNVFAPLDMHDTHILMDHQAVVPNRATSYAPNEDVGELRRLHNEPPPADGTYRIWVDNTSAPGSSSVVTTVSDMAKWMRNWETAQVGGRRVLEQMVQRGTLNDGQRIDYAFGLSVDTYRGLPTISHGGGWRGFRTHFLRFPREGLSVTVLGNSTGFNAGRTALRVAEVFLEGPLTVANEAGGNSGRERLTPQAQPIDAARLAEYIGDYTSVELATTYTVSARAGELVVSHRRMDEQILTHIGDDRFLSPGVRGMQTFEFLRDTAGRVSGYALRGARFRGVHFERMR